MDSERDSRSEQGTPLPGFGEAAPHDRDRTDQRQTGQGQADRSATTPAHGTGRGPSMPARSGPVRNPWAGVWGHTDAEVP